MELPSSILIIVLLVESTFFSTIWKKKFEQREGSFIKVCPYFQLQCARMHGPFFKGNLVVSD
jgi:hypothetical protein